MFLKREQEKSNWSQEREPKVTHIPLIKISDKLNIAAVMRMRSVGKVEARDIHPGFCHETKRLWAVTSGADGANNADAFN